jgi:hypothetical protein
MDTKEELIHNIKEWITLDNEISTLQKEMKERKEKKKKLTENLVVTMKKNELDCFDINGGALLYKKNKVKKAITGKTLMSTLQEYYKNNPIVAEEVTKFILDNREEQIKETIKRKIDK